MSLHVKPALATEMAPSPATISAELQTDIDAEQFALAKAFKGYTSIVFPVGPDNGCAGRAVDYMGRFRDEFRSWYSVTVVASCTGKQEEKFDIWLECNRRSGLVCTVIREPVDLTQPRPRP